MLYISNAFSLQMLDLTENCQIEINPVTVLDIPKEVVSVIGHADTASVVSDLLGFSTPYNRVSLRLNKGDILYVAQVVGGRLPEGCTTLPDGFEIKFVRVRLLEDE